MQEFQPLSPGPENLISEFGDDAAEVVGDEWGFLDEEAGEEDDLEVRQDDGGDLGEEISAVVGVEGREEEVGGEGSDLEGTGLKEEVGELQEEGVEVVFLAGFEQGFGG